MNQIRIIGQAITSTNYTTRRLFNFNPEPIRDMAANFLASGITEVEIPQGVLDPENRCPDTGIDRETLAQTLQLLPQETRVLGSYFGPPKLGDERNASLQRCKRTIDHFIEHFPDFTYAMLHPLGAKADDDQVREYVAFWAECAAYGRQQKPGIQLCLHNHYDGCCETAEQVRFHLQEIERVGEPGLRWGPDTGHCHGMGDDFLAVLDEFAHLIGNHIHIKAQVSAFDKLHGGDRYRPDRDIWGNKAEFGNGLYGGFVNAADPEIETPFAEVFRIIREKARPTDGVITGGMEIDIPRQHPRLEIFCATLYLTRVHGLSTGLDLDCETIVQRVLNPAG